MAFWCSETLKRSIPEQNIVQPYNESNIKHGAYEMRLGADVYRTSTDDAGKEVLAKGQQCVIPSGQFALLVTEETVSIPASALGLISIKSSLKVRGLVNVSGFHVDPGFKGQLHFAVYNAGSQPIVLARGDRLFMLWLCAFDHSTADCYDGKHNNQNGLTADEIMMIQGKVASPASLKKQLDDLKQTFDKQFYELKSDTDRKLATMEHSITIWRLIAIAIGSAILGLVLTTWVKPRLDGSSISRPPANTPPAANSSSTRP